MSIIRAFDNMARFAEADCVFIAVMKMIECQAPIPLDTINPFQAEHPH